MSFKSMTVAQLREIINNPNLNPNMKVAAMASYGDHNDTMQAIPITSVEEKEVAPTAYSASGYQVLFDGERDQFEESEMEKILVL